MIDEKKFEDMKDTIKNMGSLPPTIFLKTAQQANLLIMLDIAKELHRLNSNIETGVLVYVKRANF